MFVPIHVSLLLSTPITISILSYDIVCSFKRGHRYPNYLLPVLIRLILLHIDEYILHGAQKRFESFRGPNGSISFF